MVRTPGWDEPNGENVTLRSTLPPSGALSLGCLAKANRPGPARAVAAKLLEKCQAKIRHYLSRCGRGSGRYEAGRSRV